LVPTKGDVLVAWMNRMHMFQLVNTVKLEFQLKMLGPCVLITVTAVLKVLVSYKARHLEARYMQISMADEPIWMT
jgi:hypothetical protein